MRGETAAHCPTGLATKRGIAELYEFTGKIGVRSTGKRDIVTGITTPFGRIWALVC